MKTWRKILVGQAMLGAALFAAGALNAGQSAETPQVVNEKIETRAVTGSLRDAFRGVEAQADKAEWVGYSVAETMGDRTVCCGNFNDSYDGCGTCRLEKENGVTSTNSQKDGDRKSTRLNSSHV